MLRAALFRLASGLRRSPMAVAPFSTAAASAAWLSDGPASTPPKVRLLIGGEFVESRADEHVDVTNPATQEVVSRIPLTTTDEFRAAVDAAKTAFPGWRSTPVTARQRVMLKYQELIRANMVRQDCREHYNRAGEDTKDAWGDVFRGLEVVEHACGMGTLQMGEYVSNVSQGIDTFSIREPLGVCAGICPFNFPAMIPLWDIVNNICDDEDIKAVSFVGSNTAGMHIYSRASAAGKRVQCNMGAKNHAIVLPDADRDATLNALIAAGFGAAGQREDELVKRAKGLVVNSGMASDTDLGPVISRQVPNFEDGNFVGPTILADVRSDMECYKEEIFGPVLLLMKADNLDDAIQIVNRNKYGNGASIFTTSGINARKFQTDIEAGQVGICNANANTLAFFSLPKLPLQEILK
ncbi:hypothetical protein PR202_gb12544 [Eleusine coracana subsp. coracana]|uniref:Aldehyde dehydrogenase domain-containing protein n=1 Tax=Eleusine coracana subsp. coracana TaxID=191504 RepID=A0AAV5ERN5_ELECO|nr:hypothetical protein PR202_gb12544 [Eleusine coracana subsp. coracana]